MGMSEEDKLDSIFLTAVKNIADRHNCKDVSIDMENRIILFDCENEDEVAIAIELSELFGRKEERLC